MPQVLFRDERCKGCELCVDACPKQIIVLSPESNGLGFHPAMVTDGSGCTGCSFCVLMCPDLVITVLREEGEHGQYGPTADEG